MSDAPTPPKPKEFMQERVIKSEGEGHFEYIFKSVEDYNSRATQDLFEQHYGGSTEAGNWYILQPPFPPEQLVKLPRLNNTLAQCVDAMITNCDGFGHTLDYIGEKGQEKSKEAEAEWLRLTELLEQPCDDQSLSDIRKRRRADLESVGWGVMEIGRDATGAIIWFKHVPAHMCRKTKRENEPTETKVYLRRQGQVREIKVKKRFRRYVQITGAKKIYFKEFDDRRPINSETGSAAAIGMAITNTATEFIWSDPYAAGESYGVPRYSNNIPSILGSREAEMVNYRFFEDNAIPALAVLVSGGLLTEQTMSDIKRAYATKGKAAQNRILVLEAKADTDNVILDNKSAVPHISMQPLAKERQNDALFTEYLKGCCENIMSSFRPPPVFLGRTTDYNRATSESAMEAAKSQVFTPEQESFDRMMNEQILADAQGQPPKFYRFRSNSPKISNHDAQAKAFEQVGKLGGISINVAIEMANEWLGLKVPTREEPWADLPVEVVKSMLAAGKIKLPELDGYLNEEPEAEPEPEPAKPEPAKPEPVKKTYPRRNQPTATQNA